MWTTAGITSRGDTDKMDTMTQRKGPLPPRLTLFLIPISTVFSSGLLSPGRGAADVTELSCNRSALAIGDSCAYIF